MKFIRLLVLASAGTIPLQAQSVAPGAVDNNPPAANQTVPAPPRNIMPLSINHKPNPIQPPAEIARGIDLFFKTLRGNAAATPNSQDFYERAYDTFLNGTLLGQQKEKTSIFISKTQEAFGIYGPLRDYEIFDNYSVGSNVLVLTYLTRHSMQPLRWRFIYYRPDKSWNLINMGFDDVLLDMLD